MNSGAKDSQSKVPTQHGLSREESGTSAPTAYAAGVIWPPELGIGSLEDQLEVIRRTQANGFHVVEGKLDQLRVVAVTPQKSAPQASQLDSVRLMLQSLLQTHRPGVVICASALRVQQATARSERDQDDTPDWAQRNNICTAASLQAADGRPLIWKPAEEIKETLHAQKRAAISWFRQDAAWPSDSSLRVVTNDSPALVKTECELRDVPSLAIGVIRWMPGEEPSRELADYQASDSRAKKLGRMLRWAVKNRDAIRETARAAEADLLAADKLASEICALIKAPGTS